MQMPVEQSISSTTEEEELKSNDTTSVVASGTGTPDSSSDCLIDFICCVTAFQNFDPSSHSRARHWIDIVDTFL